jgi:hypothetical protein
MLRLPILTLVAWAVSASFTQIAVAQESPISSPTAEESLSPSISPEESATSSPIPEPTSSPSPVRNIRISFVPPPMEGTISLGICDQSGKLVRVLHQNAELNDFTIGADALVTRWNGKDDSGQDLPAGRYHARGYLIGPLKLQTLGETSPPAAEPDANTTVKVRLLRNPLRKSKQPVAELRIGLNNNGSFLETSYGLPLFKISEAPNVIRAWIAMKNENTLDVWQDEGGMVHQFRIFNMNQMMAFDCGDFELK